ncbi:MAG: nitroreductase family protein [Solobacterium sp.]|nr:nitroreductase family protein [Solobacterium sp.]
MTLHEIMRRRRSVRVYTGEAIPDDVLNEVIRAGLLAPSSRGQKPCEFYVVRNKDILAALAGVKKAGGAMLKDADAAIVVSASEQKADTWTEDCSIALTYMDLAAAEAGLGSCWVQIHLRKDADGADAEANVRKILHLGDDMRIAGILSLGVSAQVLPEHAEADPESDSVHRI